MARTHPVYVRCNTLSSHLRLIKTHTKQTHIHVNAIATQLPLNFIALSQRAFTLCRCSHQKKKEAETVCHQTGAYKNVGSTNFYRKSIRCRCEWHMRLIFKCFLAFFWSAVWLKILPKKKKKETNWSKL